MTQTLDVAGRPLFFPPSLDPDASGVILPRPFAELEPFVAQVAPEQLFPFMRKLVNGLSKRKREARWSAVNRQRLLLLRLCIDRVLLASSTDLCRAGEEVAVQLAGSMRTRLPPPIKRRTCLYPKRTTCFRRRLDPRQQLYTRQQIGSLVGLDDTTLNYWMREGILRPSTGGGGKGQHRRFSFEQVNLAAIFGQLQTFGVSMPALRRLADRFLHALEYMRSIGINRANESTFWSLRNARETAARTGFIVRWIEPDLLDEWQHHFPWVLDLERHAPSNRTRPGFDVHVTFEQEVELMRLGHLIYGRSAEAEEQITDELVSLAASIDLAEHREQDRYWTIATTYTRRSPSEEFTTSPHAFCRDASGAWFLAQDLTRLPADTTSFIGIDVELLSFKMWRPECPAS